MGLSDPIIRTYRAERARMCAADALRAARWYHDPLNVAIRCTLDDSGGTVSVDNARLTVRVDIRPDDISAEDVGLGRYTSDEDVLRDRDRGAIALGPRNAREHHIFIPDYTLRERIADNRERGMSRAVARERALADIREDERRARDWTGGLCVRTRVMWHGVELSDDGLGGCDNDAVIETVREAIHHARQMIRDGRAADIARDAAADARREAARLEALAAEAF